MMRISTWAENVAGNGHPIYEQVAKAMSQTDKVVPGDLNTDAGFIWSVLWFGRMSRNKGIWSHYRSQNKPVVVAEIGGLIREKTWRLSANGINANAVFPSVKLDPLRPTKLGLKLDPWRNGEYILICGQHGKSQQWENMPEMGEYFKQTVTEVRKYSDRPIVLRSHPRYRENLFFNVDKEFFKANNCEWNSPKQIVNTYDSYDLDPLLAHCHCVISHSSNVGFQAVLKGVPAIVAPTSLASGVSSTQIKQIETLPKPDREEWLINLSHKEWFVDELYYAWNSLRDQIDMSSMPATRKRVM